MVEADNDKDSHKDNTANEKVDLIVKADPILVKLLELAAQEKITLK